MPIREAPAREVAILSPANPSPAAPPPVARRAPPPRSGDGLSRPQRPDPLRLLPFSSGFNVLRTLSDVNRAACMGGTVATMVSLSPFLWAPPLWVLALMTPRPPDEGTAGRRNAGSLIPGRP